nr:DExH-box ATP-dependent RNA helicase DExH10 [Ipomoea batatas]
MVSELVGEGAVPPQLPTPASHAELRVQQSIRRRSLLSRQYVNPPFDSELEVFVDVGGKLADESDDLSTVLFKSSQPISWSRSMRNWSRELVDFLFVAFISWSKSVESMSAELINRSLMAIVVPSSLVLEQWLSWSRSMEISSRVLVNPLFIAFECRSWSRSVEIDDSSSEEIEDKAENDDDGEELTAVNKIRRCRFVFDDEEEQEEENDEIDVVAAGTSIRIQKLRSAQMKLDLDDLCSGYWRLVSGVNFDFFVSMQPSNACFNSNCEEAWEWPTKGWHRLTGEFADLCDCCASAYKEGNSGVSDIYKIVKMIVEWKFQPVIIFSFSRRECEQHAMSISKFDFNTEEEKDVVEQVFQNVVFCLNEEDRSLPAIELMLPLLQRGIAVHHSGLLPIIKELVELLFQEGLVKALFVTEMFAIGLSMPANLFAEFVDKLNDMVVLLPLSKIGKPKAKEDDGKIQSGENGNVAGDHYYRYLEDIDLMHDLEDRYGGWLSYKMQEDFVYFAEVCFESFGDRMKYWITINKPNLIEIAVIQFQIPPPKTNIEQSITAKLCGAKLSEGVFVDCLFFSLCLQQQ